LTPAAAITPRHREPPILISSFAGFDQLAPEGCGTDRVIANVMVSGLAGFYVDLDSHSGGSEKCPLCFNQQRKFESLVARPRFDKDCRTKLKTTLGPKLDALEALLNVFP